LTTCREKYPVPLGIFKRNKYQKVFFKLRGDFFRNPANVSLKIFRNRIINQKAQPSAGLFGLLFLVYY
jgi:hypothetical protein